MNSNCSWNIVCFYVQLKSRIPRVGIKNRASNLNPINTYFGQVDDSLNDKSVLRSLNCREDLFHFMFICDVYYLIRDSLLKNMKISQSHFVILMLMQKNE
jgi:hypothetical protein